ncbi:hypothetical protein CRG98_029193 [Punica granatum]|uniref:Uncharacterized protein n=1 Tax=Punica granatum TaxID=22663 RepID=A0A2I0J308_PUNGR|nr:hypothetical protein CRG98_029193 [Punica granatum]
MGRGPLADGRSGSPRTAAMTLRAAVLAPGRRDEGWSGRRFRPIFGENHGYPRFGGSGPAGITGSR